MQNHLGDHLQPLVARQTYVKIVRIDEINKFVKDRKYYVVFKAIFFEIVALYNVLPAEAVRRV